MAAVREQVANADLAVGEVEGTHLEKLSVAPWNSGMADDLRVLWHDHTGCHDREVRAEAKRVQGCLHRRRAKTPPTLRHRKPELAPLAPLLLYTISYCHAF